MGKAESCQPPPSRKRGRPRKSAPPDEQQQPSHHHQRQPPLHTTTPRSPAKRVCTRPETFADPPGDTNSQPPHAAAPPADRPLAPILPRPPLHAAAAAINSPFNTTASSPSSSWSPSAEEECSSSPSQTTAGSLHGHQRFAGESADRVSDPQRRDPQPTAPAPAGQDPVLRSLLMLVVDQVREIRQENERLHDTIAELRATQKETERRQARVEEGHQIKIRQLEQAHIELCQKMEHVMAHRLVHAHTSPAFPPPPQFSSSQPAALHHSPLTQPHGCAGLPLVAVTPTSRAEVERFIAQTLPFLQEFDCSSLIIRDLRYVRPTTRVFCVDTYSIARGGGIGCWPGGPSWSCE
jgi:hypothetical protein